VGEDYTTNVNFTSSNAKSDYITTVTPGITYALTGHTNGLTFNGDSSFVYYAEKPGVGESNLGNRESAALSAWDQMGIHSRLDLMDTFNRTDIPNPTYEPVFVRTDQPIPPIDTTVRRSTESYTSNFVNTRFRQDFGLDDFFTFDYTNTILTNEDPAYQNNTTNTPSVDFKYWFDQQYGIDLKATYTRGDYSVQQGTPYPSIDETIFVERFLRRLSPTFDLFLQGTQTGVNYESAGATPASGIGAIPVSGIGAAQTFRDFNIYDVIAGVDYHLSPTAFFTVSGGYFLCDVDGGNQTSGYEARADMAKQFQWGSVRLTGSTGYDTAFFGAQNLGFDKYYGATLAGTHPFSQYLTGTVSVAYRNNDYITASGQNNDLTSLLAGLTYQFRPWMSVAARFTHQNSDSASGTNSYTEDRVSLTLTFVPEEPYLLNR
jgi:hypothetical protein